MSKKIKNYRYSQNFKDAVLQEVRKEEMSIMSISKLYNVSYVTVYNWMKESSIPTPTRETIYVDLKDHKSSLDRISELEKKIQRLESALSDKVLENCALQSMVNVAKKKYGIDLKKKSDKPALKSAEK